MNKFLDKLQNVTVKSLRLTADVLNGDKSIIILMHDRRIIEKKATKSKSINFKIQKKISSISNSGFLKKIKIKNGNSKYNLVIVCGENLLNGENNLFQDKLIFSIYKL